MASCMGHVSPVRAYSLWAGLCPEKFVKLKTKNYKQKVGKLNSDFEFLFLLLLFFCRFSLVSSIYQSLLLMTKVQAHFGIQQLGCAPATTMDSA